jgi:hypothetical protein
MHRICASAAAAGIWASSADTNVAVAAAQPNDCAWLAYGMTAAIPGHMRKLLFCLVLAAGCTNVEDDILPPDAAATDGPRDAPIDVHSIEEPPCLFVPCDAAPPDAGVD